MKKIVVFLFLIIAIFLVFLYWGHLPRDSHVSYIVNSKDISEASRSEIKVLTYNIAYGRGEEDDVVVGPKTKDVIEKNLGEIGKLLREVDADIVFLQEVDFASNRTHFINEAEFLAKSAEYPSYACVTTWIKNYIPFPYWPPSKHFGRMKSGQCVLSKFKIVGNDRIALPQRRDKPFYYTAFDLTRAIQKAEIVVNGEKFTLFNVHLEAFSIENREEQIQILADLVSKNSSKNIIVGGDFNALPVAATQKGNFPDQPEKLWEEWRDVSSDRSMEIFLSTVTKLKEVIPGDRFEKETFTFPAGNPNRRLDYIFFSKEFVSKDGEVIKRAGSISDHLPVYVELKLR